MRVVASSAVSVPATGTVTYTPSATSRYLRFAGTQPVLLNLGTGGQNVYVPATQLGEVFSTAGLSSVVIQSANGSAGTIYISDMSL
jgi:hypothetical protein